MNRKFVLLLLTLVVSIVLIGCGGDDEYDKEAGVYELYSLEGDINISMFSSFEVTLTKKGNYTSIAKTTNNQTIEETGTYEIDGKKIIFTSIVDDEEVVETYDYIDGEIIMDTSLEGISIIAKFAKKGTKEIEDPETKLLGVYKLYSMQGDLSLSMYKYYDIELKKGGNFTLKAAYTANSQTYEASGTYTIENGKINLVTDAGGTKVTETYDYINGEIVMDADVMGISFIAKFKR